MTNKNKELFFASVLENIDESKQLMPSRSATVQPVALMRLGLFLPSLKRKGSDTGIINIDASKELQSLELARAEGYTDIKISGPRLSMETDFKVWVGVILAFSKYGLNGNVITLPFSEFATFCGYPAKDKDKGLRTRLGDSLARLRGTTIKLSSDKDKQGVVTGLLSRGKWDEDADEMVLVADASLWELYQLDRQVLVQMFILRQLANKGTAQALYTFLESLPEKPIPLSFARIKRRLMLTSPNNQQNRVINKAIDELKAVGYLDGDVVKKDGEWHLMITRRTPRPDIKAI
ncbi:RepB family plasmid replication initiator protein [Salmonella enterica subsp. enterica]|nr:RepB family plasmid replication initiator protein [Salmonella enterica subsp. enterica]EEJ7209131.1 RepB family plasmid replication initiator protein [Salmonella enterica subsp. enterica]